jgi:hypothetical protein
MALLAKVEPSYLSAEYEIDSIESVFDGDRIFLVRVARRFDVKQVAPQQPSAG